MDADGELPRPFDPEDLSDVVLPMPPTWSDSEDSEDEGAGTIESSGVRADTRHAELREAFKESMETAKQGLGHSHAQRGLATSADYASLIADLFDHSRIPVARRIEYAHVTTLGTDFEDKHVVASKPLMIQGIPDQFGWRAASRWSSVEAFLAHYGDVPFKITEVAQMHGMGKPMIYRVPLFMYEEYSRTSDVYIFERELEGERSELLEDFCVPPQFKNDLYDVSCETRAFFPKYRYMVIGGPRTGSNIHVDPVFTSAWNTLLCGQKRWVLFPPGEAQEYIQALGAICDGTVVPPAYWWMDVYPKLQDAGEAQRLGMVECIQEPGDTIFVPAGWWHAVINSGFTIAVTQNLLFQSQLPAVWPQLKDKHAHFAAQFAGYLKTERPECLAAVPDIQATLDAVDPLDAYRAFMP